MSDTIIHVMSSLTRKPSMQASISCYLAAEDRGDAGRSIFKYEEDNSNQRRYKSGSAASGTTDAEDSSSGDEFAIEKVLSSTNLSGSAYSEDGVDEVSSDQQSSWQHGKVAPSSSSSSSSSLQDYAVRSLADIEVEPKTLLYEGNGQIVSSSRDNSITNPWGWFNMESVDELLFQSKKVRELWLKYTLDDVLGEKAESAQSAVNILFQWRNPHHSMSTRSWSGSMTDMISRSAADTFDVQLSCSINGYRTVQRVDGEILAEFQFILCYGSNTFVAWKRFREFEKLYEIIRYSQKVVPDFDFSKSMQEWRVLKSRRPWFRCLSPVYLIEKSIHLGRFTQHLLMECESPGLLLYFARNKLSI